MSGSQTDNSLEKQELLEYSVRCSGSRKGSSRRTVLSAYNDNQARLTLSHADRYDEEPTVTEYLVERKALSDLRDAFIRHGMERWAGRKISDSMVRDGKTTTYSFAFSEHQVRFSSQIYPKQYAEPLAELDQIIEQYRTGGRKLPDKEKPE